MSCPAILDLSGHGAIEPHISAVKFDELLEMVYNHIAKGIICTTRSGARVHIRCTLEHAHTIVRAYEAWMRTSNVFQLLLDDGGEKREPEEKQDDNNNDDDNNKQQSKKRKAKK
jgi:hypothetical protein